MVDWVIESIEFSLGVRQMKVACVVVGMEGGKQVVREQVATKKIDPRELSVVVE